MGGGGLADRRTAFGYEENGQLIYTSCHESKVKPNPKSVNSIAIGNGSGGNNCDEEKGDQGAGALGVGYKTGNVNQGDAAVALGCMAGVNNQSTHAVAMGTFAGYEEQGEYSVASGFCAGYTEQGKFAVAIGASSLTPESRSPTSARIPSLNPSPSHSKPNAGYVLIMPRAWVC